MRLFRKVWYAVRGTCNRRACCTRFMNVDEAKGVCMDCSKWRQWRSVVWEKAVKFILCE